MMGIHPERCITRLVFIVWTSQRVPSQKLDVIYGVCVCVCVCVCVSYTLLVIDHDEQNNTRLNQTQEKWCNPKCGEARHGDTLLKSHLLRRWRNKLWAQGSPGKIREILSLKQNGWEHGLSSRVLAQQFQGFGVNPQYCKKMSKHKYERLMLESHSIMFYIKILIKRRSTLK
jgi:AraC-like DNA-binding protein